MSHTTPNLKLVRPNNLVLTKAEILAAIAPIQSLAARIKDTHTLFEAWHDTLPVDETGGVSDGEIIGFVDEDDQIEIADGDLDLLALLRGLDDHEYAPPFENGDLRTLTNAVGNDDRISEARAEQIMAEKAVLNTKRAAARAKTREDKRVARIRAERAKDDRIAELEAKLAKPDLRIV
jgi:hypothetical protein